MKICYNHINGFGKPVHQKWRGIMKKITSSFLAVPLAMSLVFTGCGSGGTQTSLNNTKQSGISETQANDKDSGTPVELTLWHETEAPIAEVIQAELDELAPRIKVNVVRKDQMKDTLKLMSTTKGNDGPDLIWAPHDSVGELASIGVFEPLDEWIGDKMDQFLPVTQGAGKFKEKVYQIPVCYETYIMLYNKQLLKEAPKNTDELLAMMKEKAKDGNYGCVWQHSTAYYAGAFVNGFGGFLIDENAQVGVSKNETLEGPTYQNEFVKYMPLDGEWNTVTTLFNEGKAAATFNGPWIIADAKKNGIDLGFAPLPVISKNNKPLKPFVGVQGVMMNAGSQNKEAASEVIQFLLNKDLGETLALKVGSAPAHKDAYSNGEIADNELISVIKETANNGVIMPNIPEMGVVWGPTEMALSVINKSEGADYKKALEDAQKQIETSILDMH